MTTLQISVPDTTAQRFQSLSEQQRTLVYQLVVDCLAESNTLTEVMNYISFIAARRGLSSEMPDGSPIVTN